jgi:hypothetical protein
VIKLVLIMLTALLLGGATPLPTPQAVQGSYEIHGTVEGRHRLGIIVPLGEYTARGATLAEAEANAREREAQIRATATAQAAR